MDNFIIKYFLATNSCEGFISSFGESYNARSGWRAYIIKGGPGTGKSSFMKFLAAKAADKKIEFELCPCSSDPDSLDAIIFPKKRLVILDGTAPHTLDPVYPAVCEEILNFGEFWNVEKISKSRNEIITLTDKNKQLHKKAAGYLAATGELLKDNYRQALSHTDFNKADRFAAQLCKKHIPRKKAKGSEQIRYLCGVTPKGVVSFADTAIKLTEKQIIIEDRHGSVSNYIMQKIRQFAIDNGYNIITVKNSFLPGLITDHIIIPELSLAFLREYEYQHFNSTVRRIHSRRFTNNNSKKPDLYRSTFNKRVSRELLRSCCGVLKQAKEVHDLLEAQYISAMDFDRLTLFANEFVKKLFL